VGQQAERRRLVVPGKFVGGDLGIRKQSGKHFPKLEVVRALAQLPCLLHAAAEDARVRLAVQAGKRLPVAEQHAADSGDGLPLRAAGQRRSGAAEGIARSWR
jgi:hypothetical protein